jgi:hypothetical protein
VLRFIKKKHGKTIVVINSDDPSRDLWERLCSANQTIVKEIEYTSDEKNFQSQRNMFLEMLKRGGKIQIKDMEIHNEQDLDKALGIYIKKREK